jgi:ABC-type nitrate/sulfonate/bicarbonate transport system substrate-binding protein
MNFCYAVDKAGETKKTLIRVAFPTATLINGHIGQILARTDILERNNLQGEVTGFQYGPPMMEALISDKVDVAFTSEVPATLPLAKGHPATIIASFGSLGRSAVMVLPDSPIKNIKDLKGKKIGVPFGSSPHRNLIGMLKAAGLTVNKDITVLNIGKDELAAILLKGEIDAITIWDPAVEQYIQKNKFRIVNSKDYSSVVIMNNKFIKDNPEAVNNFITAIKQAIMFVTANKETVNKWFSEASRLDPAIIDLCAKSNYNYSNVKKISDVNIALTNDFIKMMKDSAEFTFVQGMVSSTLDVSKVINPKLREEAEKKLKDDTFDVSKVNIKSN